ncbi:MAG: S9 family peptidase [Henriciella sp.]|nr:S9 family peptidase [Henriciella sp.]
MRPTLLAAISFFAASFSLATAQSDYPRPPIEAYGALPQISSAELSPDGSKLATIANLEAGTRVAIISLEGDPPVQLGIENSKARGLEFYDRNHLILHAAKTTSTYGFRGEYEYSGAFVMNLETQKVRQLLKGTKDMFPAQSGLGGIIGHGSAPEQILMPAYMGPKCSSPTYDLLKVDIKNPRGLRYQKGTNDTRDWFVGEQGRVLARERYNNKKNLYSVQAYVDKKWKTIFEVEDEILPVSILGVMPDESGLVFIKDDKDGFDTLMKLGLDDEVSGPVFPPNKTEIERIYSDANRKILGLRYAGVEPSYAFLYPALEKSVSGVLAQLPEATIYLDSWTDDRNTVLYRAFDANIGDVWLLHEVETDTLQIAGRARPAIPNEAIGPLLSIEYKAQDGLTIQAILTVPPNFVPGQSGPIPAIMLLHGGPGSYDGFDFDWVAQFFANRGYLVIQPNFRGSAGFGEKFEDAGRGEWGGKMQSDLTDGVNALVKAGYVDPENVCIVGASYGGYAALAGAVFTPDLYKCVIAVAPVSDLNRMLQSEKRDHGRDHWVISYWEDVMAEGDARRKKLQSISPANFAENAKAPILLIHGDDDTVVPFTQSTRMRSALKRADKQVELVKLKGEDHWLSVADTRMQTLRAMDAFLAEHMPVTN